MVNHSARDRRLAACLLVSAALILGYYYVLEVDRPNLSQRITLQGQILHREAASPFRYRVLVPFATQMAIVPLGRVLGHDAAFLLTYAVYDVACLVAFLAALYAFLSIWFSREQALVGTLFASLTLVVALRQHYYQPWSLLEAALFAVGLLLIYRERHFALGLVVFAAALNRETGVFLPLIYLAANLRREAWKAALPRFAVYLAIWGGVFGAVRWLMGPAEPLHTVAQIWQINTGRLRLLWAVINVIVLMGCFWGFVIRGVGRAPEFARRAGLVIPVYLLSVAVFGLWREMRLFLPVYPLLICFGLAYAYPGPSAGAADAPASGKALP